MAKKIKAKVKLNIPAGKATPAPPIGPALGQHGVAIMDFCKAYNERTSKMGDVVVPAVITIYEDRSFDFVIKTPPAAVLLKKAAGIEKGAKTTGRDKVGKVSRQQLEEIAKEKMKDLNARDLESAVKIIEGTTRSMGIEVRNTS
jgi:large subunit ribosomal protein L11